MLEMDDIHRAAERLRGVANRTPVLTSRELDRRVGASVYLKAENLQRVGAFKFRGAYNKLATIPSAELARGVLTLSSGNHAQAVALAARVRDVPALILMPRDAPQNKLAATRGYGAEIEFYDRYEEDFEELLCRVSRERGLPTIHPFDDWEVMEGQGTAGVELIEDAGPLDELVVGIGGGGLICGCATAAHALQPGARVIGVQPESGDHVRRSLDAGHRVRIPMPQTIADGMQLPEPGVNTFEVMRKRVSEVVVVSDGEIVDAMRFLFERMKVVAEPSGAAALAALLSGRVELDGERVGATISGGNISPDRFAELLASRAG